MDAYMYANIVCMCMNILGNQNLIRLWKIFVPAAQNKCPLPETRARNRVCIGIVGEWRYDNTHIGSSPFTQVCRRLVGLSGEKMTCSDRPAHCQM